MARSLADIGAAVLLAACADASAVAADAKSEASLITVANTAQLTRALASAHGGDIIRLAPGVYADLNLSGLNYASGVTVASADASHPAVIKSFSLHASSNITFAHLEFAAGGSCNGTAFGVTDSKDIVFDRDNFHGDMDMAPTAVDCGGLGIRSGVNVRVTNSDFTHFDHGLEISGTSGVFSANSFHDMRTDGIDAAPAYNVVIEDNVFTDFYPAPGDHPDCIQLWGKGAHDITISGNLYVRGAGRPIQGVFLSEDPGSVKNVTISNNTIVGGGYNGIMVMGVEDLKIASNTVAAHRDVDSWIRLQKDSGVTETNNKASSYPARDNLRVTQSGNVTSSVVTDGGKVLVTKWLAAHPGWTGTLPASLSQLAGGRRASNPSDRGGG